MRMSKLLGVGVKVLALLGLVMFFGCRNEVDSDFTEPPVTEQEPELEPEPVPDVLTIEFDDARNQDAATFKVFDAADYHPLLSDTGDVKSSDFAEFSNDDFAVFVKSNASSATITYSTDKSIPSAAYDSKQGISLAGIGGEGLVVRVKCVLGEKSAEIARRYYKGTILNSSNCKILDYKLDYDQIKDAIRGERYAPEATDPQKAEWAKTPFLGPIIIPKELGGKEVKAIAHEAFGGYICGEDMEEQFGDGVEWGDEDNENPFYTPSLIAIPSTVTKIYPEAFYHGRDAKKPVLLKSIYLPSSVEWIGGSAFFKGTSSVNYDFYYDGSKSEWDTLSQKSYGWNEGLSGSKVHCSDGTNTSL